MKRRLDYVRWVSLQHATRCAEGHGFDFRWGLETYSSFQPRLYPMEGLLVVAQGMAGSSKHIGIWYFPESHAYLIVPKTLLFSEFLVKVISDLNEIVSVRGCINLPVYCILVSSTASLQLKKAKTLKGP